MSVVNSNNTVCVQFSDHSTMVFFGSKSAVISSGGIVTTSDGEIIKHEDKRLSWRVLARAAYALGARSGVKLLFKQQL